MAFGVAVAFPVPVLAVVFVVAALLNLLTVAVVAVHRTHQLSAEDPCRWATMERHEGLVHNGFCPFVVISGFGGLSSSIGIRSISMYEHTYVQRFE